MTLMGRDEPPPLIKELVKEICLTLVLHIQHCPLETALCA